MYFKMKNYFLNLCFFFMLLGMILGLNSVSWLMMWMSMEITLLFFIPNLVLSKSLIESFSCLKYFIFQCLGSIFFILGSLDFFNIMFIFGLIFKLGFFPGHFWMLSMSKGLNWMNFFFLMTIQKVLPLIFIIFSMKFLMFMFFILIMLNSTMGSLGSINQMDFRMLMIFSSMNHMSWMIISSSMNMFYFYFYFYFYIVLMFYFYLIMKKLNIFYLFQIFYLKIFSLNYILLIIVMLFFSFMGFPPFMGFFLKLISLTSLLSFFFSFILFFLMIQNLFISYAYIRVIIFMMLNYSRSLKVNFIYFKKYFNLFNMFFFVIML